MLDKTYLEKQAIKQQTTYSNIAREYIQNLFLRSFYTKKDSENFLFKGGTALRIAFKSPRFSEDLDFTGFGDIEVYEKVLEEVFYDLMSDGLDVNIEESKRTSGGYLANIAVTLNKESFLIKNQISFREKMAKKSENILITSDLLPAYNIYLLDSKTLLREKIKALITRSKPRDFFDLHYILVNENLRRRIDFNETDRKKIISCVKLQDKRELETELKRFLPNSFWVIIKDLPSRLITELEQR